MKCWIAIAFATAAFALEYEIGANIGYRFYRNGSIPSSNGTAEAGIRNRFAAGIDLGYEFSNYVSAQFSYLYHDGHPSSKLPGSSRTSRASHMRSRWGGYFASSGASIACGHS